jgi:galactose mutarotase-like enzyme
MTPPTALALPPDAATRVPCIIRADATQDGFDVVRLRSRDAFEAAFAPHVGLTCCSLLHGGAELLGERFGLAAYASCGITMGMSLMHPWANRLSSWNYTACGATVRLPVSPRLHTDRWGLPANGVQSCRHAWVLEDSGAAAESAWLEATLPFDRDPRQLELFPFPHRLHLRAEVTGCCLRISAEIEATGGVAVPVCFGYRLYLRRAQPGGDATIVLPARRRVVTDERLLPTGATEPLEMSASTLGIDELHEVFSFGADRRLTIASDARRLTFESLTGFPLAQVRTVASEPHVIVEALTVAPDALSRDAFPVATPGRPYRAALRLSATDLWFDRARLSA